MIGGFQCSCPPMKSLPLRAPPSPTCASITALCRPTRLPASLPRWKPANGRAAGLQKQKRRLPCIFGGSVGDGRDGNRGSKRLPDCVGPLLSDSKVSGDAARRHRERSNRKLDRAEAHVQVEHIVINRRRAGRVCHVVYRDMSDLPAASGANGALAVRGAGNSPDSAMLNRVPGVDSQFKLEAVDRGGPSTCEAAP